MCSHALPTWQFAPSIVEMAACQARHWLILFNDTAVRRVNSSQIKKLLLFKQFHKRRYITEACLPFSSIHNYFPCAFGFTHVKFAKKYKYILRNNTLQEGNLLRLLYLTPRSFVLRQYYTCYIIKITIGKWK